MYFLVLVFAILGFFAVCISLPRNHFSFHCASLFVLFVVFVMDLPFVSCLPKVMRDC